MLVLEPLQAARGDVVLDSRGLGACGLFGGVAVLSSLSDFFVDVFLMRSTNSITTGRHTAKIRRPLPTSGDNTTRLAVQANSARNHEWPALLAIVGAFAAGWWLVLPHVNVPVIDDWVYAWSVEHLLATGRLQVLEISAFYPIAQILWGSAFTYVAGFSFVVLRASTVVLAIFGCWAVYLTLRELDCRRSTALLGALALALIPRYFALSFSFMTEVPFVSFSTMALYWYVRAIRRSQPASVWAGCLVRWPLS